MADDKLGVPPSSAEDLDEDRLKLDPLEAGMDPPEHWTAADKYGTTPYEQAHARTLDERLAEEQPEDDRPVPPDDGVTTPESVPEVDERARSEAVARGQSADEAGGSVAGAIRNPED
ncbi:hypothetical protein [Actinosynnema sp. NPDC020468]|uniref:hypothetical protein n=1 Tax=Actinosynnema sp. NPDC020468 TaxID=3154488 RepID=UPI0033DA7CB0